MSTVTFFGTPVNTTDPAKPAPTTSPLGMSVSRPHDDGWSRDSFLVATGRAAGEGVATAFGSKDDALAAARALSTGSQPAVAVRFDGATGPRGSTPWVVESLVLANPTAVGFVDRAGREHHRGWDLDHDLLDLEGSMSNPNHAAWRAKIIGGAPVTNGLTAVVDGAVLVSFD